MYSKKIIFLEFRRWSYLIWTRPCSEQHSTPQTMSLMWLSSGEGAKPQSHGTAVTLRLTIAKICRLYFRGFLELIVLARLPVLDFRVKED